MSILGADISFLRQICIDKSFLTNDQVQEQTANILGKVSEANWSDIQPDNHKLLFFACRQYLGMCLQRQVGLENLLAKKINHKLENNQNKDVALESNKACKSVTSTTTPRGVIEDAIEATSETLSYVLFHDFSLLFSFNDLSCQFQARCTPNFLKSKTMGLTVTAQYRP